MTYVAVFEAAAEAADALLEAYEAGQEIGLLAKAARRTAQAADDTENAFLPMADIKEIRIQAGFAAEALEVVFHALNRSMVANPAEGDVLWALGCMRPFAASERRMPAFLAGATPIAARPSNRLAA